METKALLTIVIVILIGVLAVFVIEVSKDETQAGIKSQYESLSADHANNVANRQMSENTRTD